MRYKQLFEDNQILFSYGAGEVQPYRVGVSGQGHYFSKLKNALEYFQSVAYKA